MIRVTKMDLAAGVLWPKHRWVLPDPFMKFAPLHHFALSLLLTAVAQLQAEDRIDLDRRSPVPAGEPIPVADFFRPDFISEPMINPSGTRVAALVAAGEDRHSLLVEDLTTQKLDGFDPQGRTDIISVEWLTDERIAFRIALYKTYGSGLYATEIGRLREPYPLLQYIAPRLIAVPQRQRTRPLAWIPPETMNAGRQAQLVVINTDIRTDQMANLMRAGASASEIKDVEEDNQKHIERSINGPAEGYDAGFLADREGQPAFAFTAHDGIFTLFRRSGETWAKCPVNLDEVEVIGYGRTHDEVVVLGPRQEGQPRSLQFLDASTGKLGETLLQDPNYDFYGKLYYEPGTHGILGVHYDRSGPVSLWFNEAYIRLQKLLDGYFPRQIVRLIDADEAGKILLVETQSDRDAPGYFWVDLAKKAFGPIGKAKPWLDPQRMRPTSVASYKTHDGRKLDLYVTFPEGVSRQHAVPLIVLPPGLPQLWRNDFVVRRERASAAFDSLTQFFVSRGYAVLRPNHRGSAGYGWEFPPDDAWEFGKMADDVTAAARYLLTSGMIDEKRVGIVGFGFSGYLAVAAAEADPGLFRAVVTFHGTYDWSKYLRTQKYYQYSGANYGVIARHLGDDKKLEELSVNNRLNRLHAAVFVGYQRELGDSTAQSTNLVSDLDHANVPHESLGVGNERSTINYLRNQVELYSRAETFLAKYLNPTAPPLAADAK